MPKSFKNDLKIELSAPRVSIFVFWGGLGSAKGQIFEDLLINPQNHKKSQKRGQPSQSEPFLEFAPHRTQVQSSLRTI